MNTQITDTISVNSDTEKIVIQSINKDPIVVNSKGEAMKLASALLVWALSKNN